MIAEDVAGKVYRQLPSGSILGSIPEDDLVKLLLPSRVRAYKSGETVIEQGTTGDSMMLVLYGQLKVCLRTAQGKDVVLSYIGPGEIAGEIALLDGGVRTASVVAEQETEVVVIKRRDLIPFLQDHGAVALRIIETLCGRLRQTNNMVENQATRAKAQRLALGLLRLADEHGVVGEDGIVAIRVRQSDLGGFVKLSRENVNRQLGEWADEDIVTLSRGVIAITNRAALEKIADLQD